MGGGRRRLLLYQPHYLDPLKCNFELCPKILNEKWLLSCFIQCHCAQVLKTITFQKPPYFSVPMLWVLLRRLSLLFSCQAEP